MPSFGSAIRQTKVADFSPEQVAFLTYGRGMDTTRMRTMLGFEPRYTTAEALDDFAGSLGTGLLAPDRLRAAEQVLAGAMRAVGSPATAVPTTTAAPTRALAPRTGGPRWVTPRSSRSARGDDPVAATAASGPRPAAAASPPAPRRAPATTLLPRQPVDDGR